MCLCGGIICYYELCFAIKVSKFKVVYYEGLYVISIKISCIGRSCQRLHDICQAYEKRVINIIASIRCSIEYVCCLLSVYDV